MADAALADELPADVEVRADEPLRRGLPVRADTLKTEFHRPCAGDQRIEQVSAELIGEVESQPALAGPETCRAHAPTHDPEGHRFAVEEGGTAALVPRPDRRAHQPV